jgi:hypothetical protein
VLVLLLPAGTCPAGVHQPVVTFQPRASVLGHVDADCASPYLGGGAWACGHLCPGLSCCGAQEHCFRVCRLATVHGLCADLSAHHDLQSAQSAGLCQFACRAALGLGTACVDHQSGLSGRWCGPRLCDQLCTAPWAGWGAMCWLSAVGELARQPRLSCVSPGFDSWCLDRGRMPSSLTGAASLPRLQLWLR